MKAFIQAKTAAHRAVIGFIAALALTGVLGALAATIVPAAQAGGEEQITINPLITIDGNVVSAADVETGQVTVLSYVNAKGVTNKSFNRAESRGLCRNIGEGTDIPVFTNTGKRGGKLIKFRDTRPTRACWINGHWIKKGPCHNILFFTPGPELGSVIVVRSLANITLRLHAEVEVVATGSCGFARAFSFADLSVQVKDFVKTKGSALTKMWIKLKGKVTASVMASVKCQPGVTVTTTTPAPTPGTTTSTTSTTVTTTTTSSTTTTTTVQHSCSLAVQSPKSSSTTVNASVTTDVSPSSVNINWGDGSSSGGSSASHTYPTPAPSPVAGDGVNYTVSASATFGSQTAFCGSQTVFIPSPPPNGNGGPPPPPPPSPLVFGL